uniref:CCR4-NOT transcription complex subunit 9 n=1 Tax=Phaeomonas parva TaxID=124430 RepID=A0A6U4D2J8_9STRA
MGGRGGVGIENLYPLIENLRNPATRDVALQELSKERETYEDLAPVLWYSSGTIAALLQEIISIYPMLTPPTLTALASSRVCNALALLQCVASHRDTRALFLKAHIPLYLYPFLNTFSDQRPFEYLRLTSLGVIGALVKVKVDDSDVVSFLLQTEIIPLCLRIMETGGELPMTVATFIVEKILADDTGLNYVCKTYDRFATVTRVLDDMITEKSPPPRLLKHIIRCYLRLSDNPRAREALRQCLPEVLRDGGSHFGPAIRDDQNVRRWLATLQHNLGEGSPAVGAAPLPDMPGAGPGH